MSLGWPHSIGRVLALAWGLTLGVAPGVARAQEEAVRQPPPPPEATEEADSEP